ncbi:Uncharacterized protein TCM_013642 [Theobroma cacao]|uniref:Uncharacterized protein n=1 Tax=Theobroma cacao TaxID=3641 RepID=A0A061FXT8_THECC|nr:Uncharacterized protein TCM_013642 [Theobroma cacao]
MASKRSRVESGKGVATEEEDILDNVATYLVKLMDQIENMEKDIRGLMDKLLVRTEVLETEILGNNKILAKIYEIADEIRKK